MSDSHSCIRIGAHVTRRGDTGALVELMCESAKLSASEELREVADNLARNVAHKSPIVVHENELPQRMIDQVIEEVDSHLGRPAEATGWLVEARKRRIDELIGRQQRRYCLMAQTYLDPEAPADEDNISVAEYLAREGQRLGETLTISAFARMPSSRPKAPRPTSARLVSTYFHSKRAFTGELTVNEWVATWPPEEMLKFRKSIHEALREDR